MKHHFHLPYNVFDTHFHALHMESRGLNVCEILKYAFANGLIGGIEVAVDETGFESRIELTEMFKELRISAGIHPTSLIDNGAMSWQNRFKLIERQAMLPEVVAIGESGLDFLHVHTREQEEAFEAHLDLASRLEKPIIIHNRDADERILEIVEKSSCRQGVFHCFSSGWEMAQRILALGYNISLAGNITYRNTEELHETIRRIPSDRILIETDSPYLSPQSVRKKINHPGHIGYTLEAIATIREEDPALLAFNTVENARRLFSIGASIYEEEDR